MAHTARKGDERKEYFDSEEELNRKVAMAAAWIRASKATIAFTGAGISTAAGIPDFRSGMKTCLTTGPGVWELRAHKARRSTKSKTVASTLKAIPTPTHMTLCAMESGGMLHHLVSQNTDGLHRRSAFPPGKLSELHGNSNLELCGGRPTKKGGRPAKGCGQEYLRDFKCRARGLSVFDHRTGRKCPHCRSDLHDSIINFGEDLPDKAIDDGFRWGDRAEVCLAMGSSLTVTPAADIPANVAKPSRARGGKAGKLVIVNLQKTPLDRDAALVVHAKCEVFSAKLAQALGLEIPPFRLKRYVKVKAGRVDRSGNRSVELSGQDVDGTPYELVRKVTVVEGEGKVVGLSHGDTGGANASVPARGRAVVPTTFRIQFMGHYQELPLRLTVDASKLNKRTAATGGASADPGAGGSAGSKGTSSGGSSDAEEVVLRCSYDPKVGEWVGVEATRDGAACKMPSWLAVAAEKRSRSEIGGATAASGGAGPAAMRGHTGSKMVARRAAPAAGGATGKSVKRPVAPSGGAGVSISAAYSALGS